MRHVLSGLALAAALGLAASSPSIAMGTMPDEAPAKPPVACKLADKSKCPKAADKPPAADCKLADKSKCPPKQSFLDQYKAAVVLIEAKRYDDALVAMRALDDGNSADVITYIGFIERKLGRMAEAQMYYEAALHMKPNHRGALEYYGEWYVMMGNIAKAKENLSTIATVYGRDTKEYVALARMIDDTVGQQKS